MRYLRGTMRTLGSPGAKVVECEACAINKEQVVGFWQPKREIPFGSLYPALGPLYYRAPALLWDPAEGGQVYDLNDLLYSRNGWNLTFANGINDQGRIVGIGERYGVPHAFLLTPIRK